MYGKVFFFFFALLALSVNAQSVPADIAAQTNIQYQNVGGGVANTDGTNIGVANENNAAQGSTIDNAISISAGNGGRK